MMDNLKTVNVKSVWGNGFVTVNSRYVEDALNKKQGLLIKCKGAEMEIPYKELQKKSPRDKVYTDKWGRGAYTLYDFFWKGKNE